MIWTLAVFLHNTPIPSFFYGGDFSAVPAGAVLTVLLLAEFVAAIAAVDKDGHDGVDLRKLKMNQTKNSLYGITKSKTEKTVRKIKGTACYTV